VSTTVDRIVVETNGPLELISQIDQQLCGGLLNGDRLINQVLQPLGHIIGVVSHGGLRPATIVHGTDNLRDCARTTLLAGDG
jgi:hypothetical protein